MPSTEDVPEASLRHSSSGWPQLIFAFAGFFRLLPETAGLALVFLFAASAWSQQPPPAVPPLAPPLAPGKPELPPLPPPPLNQQSIQAAFSVLLDPAHGGSDTGARIGEHLLEKDLTLGFAVRLRSALAARGIAVVVTRDSDADPPTDLRAGIANHALASACLVIHTTATGTGVHLYTSSLAPPTAPIPSILPWQTAQEGWVTRSLRLTSEINSALGQAGVPTTLGRTFLPPLDNLTCPAVAIEIAPLAASPASKAAPRPTSISDLKYQQRLLDAITAALLEWSTEWKEQP